MITRRLMIGAATATPAVSSTALPDPALAACRAFLAVDAEIDRLQRCWTRLEDDLMAGRGGVETRALEAIDAMLEPLFARRAALLAPLPTLVTASHVGVAGKLAVALRLVPPEDHPTAHALLAGALRDLAAS